MSDSVWPHRRQPTRLPSPWDSPGKNTGVGCHFLLRFMKVKSESEVAQSCLTLSDPMDCSLPGSSVHGIFQAGVLEWGAIAFSLSVSSTAFILVFSISWQWCLLKNTHTHTVFMMPVNSRHENDLAINRSCTLLSRHYLVETVFWYKARLKINIKQFFNWQQLGFLSTHMYLMHYIVLCSSINWFFMNVLIPVVCIFFLRKYYMSIPMPTSWHALWVYPLYKFLLVKLLNYGVYALKSVVGIAE